MSGSLVVPASTTAYLSCSLPSQSSTRTVYHATLPGSYEYLGNRTIGKREHRHLHRRVGCGDGVDDTLLDAIGRRERDHDGCCADGEGVDGVVGLVVGELSAEKFVEFGMVNVGKQCGDNDDGILTIERKAFVGEVDTARPGDLVVKDGEFIVHQAAFGVVDDGNTCGLDRIVCRLIRWIDTIVVVADDTHSQSSLFGGNQSVADAGTVEVVESDVDTARRVSSQGREQPVGGAGVGRGAAVEAAQKQRREGVVGGAGCGCRRKLPYEHAGEERNEQELAEA